MNRFKILRRIVIAALIGVYAAAVPPAQAETANSPASSTSKSGTTGSTVSANLNAPPISGELLNLSDKFNLATLKTTQVAISLTNDNQTPTLQADFSTGANSYPNVQFPVPTKGWNLSAFGGVQVDLTNKGAAPVTAALRVDNAGEWKDSPWNTESVQLAPGKGATLQLRFGQSGGAPGFLLDPTQIVGIQVFLITPKQNATLLIKNLKAFGSPQDRAVGLTSPTDRDKPVTPPVWLGQRPPVEGDWVQTLNENFDGTTINDKLWSDKTWWNGLLNGQTQRYSKDNLLLENGILKIKNEKRPGPQYDDPALPSRDYTTGHLITYNKWTQLYGYFEARIKLPTARGLWPAFWMMPDRGEAVGKEGWQRENTKDGGMEIDILEHLTEWGPGRYNVAAHWDGYDTDHKQWGTANLYYGSTPDGWHNFGLLWEPGKLTWYCDGRKTAEFVNERVGSVPAYLLINVQMGGWATKDVDEAKLPDYMQVDYVRAWQLKNRLKQ